MQGSDRNSPSTGFLPIATIVAIVAAIAVNAWTNLSPPNGLTIGEIANTILKDVLITPANYAFAIWGLIYLGLIAFGIYQVLPPQRNNARLQRVRAPIIWSSVLQIVWVFLFQFQQFWWSVVFIVGILFSLIRAFLGVRSSEPRISRQEKWLVQIPISVYFGWISVATIVNVASALFISRWNGWGISPVVWTVIMLVIAAAIAVLIEVEYQDGAYPLVAVWALIAIATRQASQPAIIVTAVGLAIGLALLVLVNQFKFGPRFS